MNKSSRAGGVKGLGCSRNHATSPRFRPDLPLFNLVCASAVLVGAGNMVCGGFPPEGLTLLSCCLYAHAFQPVLLPRLAAAGASED